MDAERCGIRQPIEKTIQGAARRGVRVRASFLAFALTCLIFSGVLSGIASDASAANEVSLGWEDWRPYQYKDDSGQLSGLDIELVSLVIKNMGDSVTYVELPWKRHLNNVKSGRTDLAASASKTSEREKFAWFSDPYRQESAVLYVRKEDANAYSFKSLKDMIGTGFRLAVTRGYYYGKEFEQLKSNPEFQKLITEVNDNQLAQRQLVRKRVDGFLEDPIAATEEMKIEGVLDQVHEFMPIYSDDIHVMISKKSKSEDYVARFNKSLSELRENGEYQKIVDKYQKK